MNRREIWPSAKLIPEEKGAVVGKTKKEQQQTCLCSRDSGARMQIIASRCARIKGSIPSDQWLDSLKITAPLARLFNKYRRLRMI